MYRIKHKKSTINLESIATPLGKAKHICIKNKKKIKKKRTLSDLTVDVADGEARPVDGNVPIFYGGFGVLGGGAHYCFVGFSLFCFVLFCFVLFWEGRLFCFVLFCFVLGVVSKRQDRLLQRTRHVRHVDRSIDPTTTTPPHTPNKQHTRACRSITHHHTTTPRTPCSRCRARWPARP